MADHPESGILDRIDCFIYRRDKQFVFENTLKCVVAGSIGNNLFA